MKSSFFKIWELGSGKLKLSLTGHISTVRGLAVSPRQPYLFSCGEDKQVKCWDLEYNKVCKFEHFFKPRNTMQVLINCYSRIRFLHWHSINIS